MTTLLDRVPLERINDRARDVRPGRTVLALLASLLFAAGWVACKACVVTWAAAVWCGAAVIEGWMSAKAGQRAP